VIHQPTVTLASLSPREAHGQYAHPLTSVWPHRGTSRRSASGATWNAPWQGPSATPGLAHKAHAQYTTANYTPAPRVADSSGPRSGRRVSSVCVTYGQPPGELRLHTSPPPRRRSCTHAQPPPAPSVTGASRVRVCVTHVRRTFAGWESARGRAGDDKNRPGMTRACQPDVRDASRSCQPESRPVQGHCRPAPRALAAPRRAPLFL
jgi:hypothetical protein